MWVVMALVPQPISSGTILRHEVTENLMQPRDGKTGSGEPGLLVQPVGITRAWNWRSALRSRMELPSTSCYSWWGAHLAPTGVLNMYRANDLKMFGTISPFFNSSFRYALLVSQWRKSTVEVVVALCKSNLIKKAELCGFIVSTESALLLSNQKIRLWWLWSTSQWWLWWPAPSQRTVQPGPKGVLQPYGTTYDLLLHQLYMCRYINCWKQIQFVCCLIFLMEQ